MADLIAFHTYHSRHSFLSPSAMIPRPNSHKRSLSSGNRSPSPDRTITKARSTDGLSRFTADKPAPAVRSTSVGEFPDSGFSTIQDPRSANSSDDSETSSPMSHHPDLNDEVAALSLKLVQAINNQTNLDDSLVATRQQLERAQAMVETLGLENEKYRRDIDQEVLIHKADAELEISRLQEDLAEEKSQRAVIEKAKKTIEQELETLTAALFEEANKMVAAAKLERDEVEKKNEQLRTQVKDTESLLASHQDQLAELKSVIQGMNPVKDDTDFRTTVSTPSSSPAAPRQLQGMVKKNCTPETSDLSVPASEEPSPGPSTSFPDLVKSVCRTDLQAFEEFREMFTLPSSGSSRPSSRAPSGTYSGLNVMSLANLSSGFGSNSSSPSKSQPHSPSGSVSSTQPSTHFPLKETRFYKRVLVEDVEPTLRLDLAPGISWLTRRTVMSGICEGTLLIEPTPASLKSLEFPCTLCGERRSGPKYERSHRFRTSDNETAQRYSLCGLCLERVRSCCELTGYLRLILDAHVKAGDVEEEKDAWEETIRLREKMFWSRIGGGVVPLYSANEANGTDPVAYDQTDGPSALESTGVQTELDYGYDEDHNDSDSDRASVYDDPFVSAGSASPASSAVSAVPSGHPGPLDLNMTEEVYEPSIERVTISAVDHHSDEAAPEETHTRQITTQNDTEGRAQ